MMTNFDKRISKKPGDLPTVFFEENERQEALKNSLISDNNILLIHDNPAQEIEDIIRVHANYMRGWAEILKLYPERNEDLIKRFPWYQAGHDDVDAIISHNQKNNPINDLSFRTWCNQQNQHKRTGTRILADSWTHIALVEPNRLETLASTRKAFIVPLHLTVLADQLQSENPSHVETKGAIEPKIPTCITYPALSSALDVYSDQKIEEIEEEEKQKNQFENPCDAKVSNEKTSKSTAPKPYVNSWYSAVETGIKQGFTLYRKISVDDRPWPDKLYFRWAIDLSSLYHAYYERLQNNSKIKHSRNHINWQNRLISRGSGGAAFALAAAQALARADRRGAFAIPKQPSS